MFTIFYSWKSDLPGNQCKNFIRNCIDAAALEVTSTEAIGSSTASEIAYAQATGKTVRYLEEK